MELVAIDHPTQVTEILSDDEIARLGGVDALRAVALANLRRLPPPQPTRIPTDPQRTDADVHVLTREDFFVATRLLVLDEVLARACVPGSPHGVLVAVPNRHLLAVHPVAGLGVLSAAETLVAIAQDECAGRAGAISPHLYFRPAPGALWERVTRQQPDGATVPEATGSLYDAFVALGLLGG